MKPNTNVIISWIIVLGFLSGIGYLVSENKLDLTIFTQPKIQANQTSDTKTVKHVADGDTITLDNGSKIRLLYIDTPESVKAETPVMCYGMESKLFLKNLLEGKKVKLVEDKEKKDQYGRDLRIVFLENVDTSDFNNSVNARLVREGYARARIFAPNKIYEPQIRKLEKQAKTENLGLWKNCTYQEAFGK